MNLAPSATVSEVLREAADRLSAAGCETPRLDAEVLLAHAAGWDRANLVIHSRDVVAPEVTTSFQAMIKRRRAREPVAYITGRRAFRHIELNVDRRVLIPRPETELLVEVGLGLEAGARVLDVGTGSGAVALALAAERPDLVVSGSDVSSEALEVARANAARLRLDVSFLHADLLSEAGVVDAVLANLPYVEDGASLPPEITGYEPAGALFAGPDGLDVVRRLAGQLDGVKLVALEVGAGQADAVAELLTGFATVERRCDLAGIERVVVGRR